MTRQLTPRQRVLTALRRREPDRVPLDVAFDTATDDAAVFHGGVDTQQVLPFGTIADVEREVLDCFTILHRGGGYIMAGSHCFQPEVPPEHILAMYDIAHEQCRYR